MIPQVELQMTKIKKGDRLLKIFGSEKFSFEKAYAKSVVDWSGFYTQLNPQHSMRYLTKKWDDGANEACLVLLTPKINIRLLKIKDSKIFSDHKIPGEQKAQIIKENLKKNNDHKFSEIGLNTIHEGDILLKFLGQRQILMECVDMEDNEIIIPHQLLNDKYFSFKTLISFKKSSDGLLRTIGWKWGQHNTENQNIWFPIKGQPQYQPYLILEQNPLISQFLSELNRNE